MIDLYLVTLAYFSCPAVSQNWAFMINSPIVKVLGEKSTPIVGREVSLKASLVNLEIRLVFPTPESPRSGFSTYHDYLEHVVEVIFFAAHS